MVLFQTEKDETSTDQPAQIATYKKKKKIRSSVGLIDYHTIPPNILPQSPSARWRWVIRKIMLMNRRKMLKIGLGRTRIEKCQTVSYKIEQMEAEILSSALQIDGSIQKSILGMENKFMQSILGVESAFTKEVQTSNILLKSLDEKVQSLNSNFDQLSHLQSDSNDRVDIIANRVGNLEHQVLNFARVDDTKQPLESIPLPLPISDVLVNQNEEITVVKNKFDQLTLSSVRMLNANITSFESTMGVLLPRVESSLELVSKLRDGEEITVPKLLVVTAEIQSYLSIVFSVSLEMNNFENLINSYKEQCPNECDGMLERVQLLHAALSGIETRLQDAKYCCNDEIINEPRSNREELPVAVNIQPPVESSISEISCNVDALSWNMKITELESRFQDLSSAIAQLSERDALMSEELRNLSSSFHELKSSKITEIEVPSLQTANQNYLAASREQEIDELSRILTLIQTEQKDQKGEVERLSSAFSDLATELASRPKSSIRTNNTKPPKPNNFSLLEDSPRDTERKDVDFIASSKSGVSLPLQNLPSKKETPETSSFTPQVSSRANSASKKRPISSHPPHYFLSEISNPSNQSTANSISPAPSLSEEELKVIAGNIIQSLVPQYIHEYLQSQPIIKNIDAVHSTQQCKSTPRVSTHNSPRVGKTESLLANSHSNDSNLNDEYSDLQNPDVGEKKRRNTGNLIGSFVDYDAKRQLNSLPHEEICDTRLSGRKEKDILLSVMESIPPPFDPSPLLADIATLRAENLMLQKRLEIATRDQLSREDIMQITMDLLREQKRKEMKNDSKPILDELNKSIQTISQEITSMKRNQDSYTVQLKEEMENSLNNAMNHVAHELTEQKEAVISTKGLCLGCGRTSNVKIQPSSRSTSPLFFPALSSQISPGPDIYRAGFKMPVRTTSPPGSPGGGTGGEIPLIMRSKVMTSNEVALQLLKPHVQLLKDTKLQPSITSMNGQVIDEVPSIITGLAVFFVALV